MDLVGREDWGEGGLREKHRATRLVKVGQRRSGFGNPAFYP